MGKRETAGWALKSHIWVIERAHGFDLLVVFL